jgi:ketosteroid isomerase-like protein
VSSKLTAEQVKAAVRRFWDVFTSKSAEGLADFYAHESCVFGSKGTRSEPGRLAAARRNREYFHSHSVLKAAPGEVEIVLLGESAAVASYTFKFHATKVAGMLDKGSEENILHGRATQVFALDPSGVLRIVHEHLSVPDSP